MGEPGWFSLRGCRFTDRTRPCTRVLFSVEREIKITHTNVGIGLKSFGVSDKTAIPRFLER